MTVAKKVRRTTIITAIAVLGVFVLLSYIIVSSFFNPVDDFNNTQGIFVLLNNTIAPEVTFSHINQHRTSLITQRLTFEVRTHHSRHRTESTYIDGTINFRFGRASLVDFNDSGNIGGLTMPQSAFMSQSVVHDYWTEIDDNRMYIAWLAFDEILPFYLANELHPQLFSVYDHPRLSGTIWLSPNIHWLAVQTSDNPDDIVMGFRGGQGFRNETGMLLRPCQDSNNLSDAMDGFRTTLNFLNGFFSQPCNEAVNRFLATDLWYNADTICFQERHNFVQRNGENLLGVTVRMVGYDLRNLQDTGVNIVRLIED
ncbi:MAG: hypothetical protein FWB93_01530 [Oscillospiraceae bacterium]|nr:hypothetical protein [Oscillospiraceae bacterium]